VKSLSDYLIVCDDNPPTSQTDKRYTITPAHMNMNTALCVASRGKMTAAVN